MCLSPSWSKALGTVLQGKLVDLDKRKLVKGL